MKSIVEVLVCVCVCTSVSEPALRSGMFGVCNKCSQLCPAGHLVGNRNCPEHEGIVNSSHTVCGSGNSEGVMFSKTTIVISLLSFFLLRFFLVSELHVSDLFCLHSSKAVECCCPAIFCRHGAAEDDQRGAGAAALQQCHSGALWKGFPYRASANMLEMGPEPLAWISLFRSRDCSNTVIDPGTCSLGLSGVQKLSLLVNQGAWLMTFPVPIKQLCISANGLKQYQVPSLFPGTITVLFFVVSEHSAIAVEMFTTCI